MNKEICKHASSVVYDSGYRSCHFGPGWGELPTGVRRMRSGEIPSGSSMHHDRPDCGVCGDVNRCTLPNGCSPLTKTT
jgi:hypothetical protein